MRVLPLVHVTDMGQALDFYQKLGFTTEQGSRDGDWAELQLGSSALGLLAHEPGEGEQQLQLTLSSRQPLDGLEEQFRQAGVNIVKPFSDEGFGASLYVQDPDGLVIEINQLDPHLYG